MAPCNPIVNAVNAYMSTFVRCFSPFRIQYEHGCACTIHAPYRPIMRLMACWCAISAGSTWPRGGARSQRRRARVARRANDESFLPQCGTAVRSSSAALRPRPVTEPRPVTGKPLPTQYCTGRKFLLRAALREAASSLPKSTWSGIAPRAKKAFPEIQTMQMVCCTFVAANTRPLW